MAFGQQPKARRRPQGCQDPRLGTRTALYCSRLLPWEDQELTPHLSGVRNRRLVLRLLLAWRRSEKSAVTALTKPLPKLIRSVFPSLLSAMAIPASDLGLLRSQPTGHSLFCCWNAFPLSPPSAQTHALFPLPAGAADFLGSTHVFFIISTCIYPQPWPLWLVLTPPPASLGGPQPRLIPGFPRTWLSAWHSR